MKKTIPLIGLLLAARICSAGTFPVPAEYPTIQAGLDAAGNGDTVLVADDTYTGAGNRDLDFGGENIVLLSANGPEFTIIDCQGDGANHHRGFYIHTGESATAVIDGFTITGGYADSGGGIFCVNSSPTIRDCIITGNYAVEGGAGMFSLDLTGQASPTLIRCTFASNMTFRGGGLLCAGGPVNCVPLLIDCTFSENIAGKGAGLYLEHADAVVTGCRFLGNRAEIADYNEGGGMLCNSSSPILTDCVFDRNRADVGGGMECLDSAPEVTLCVFSNNEAWSGGGLVYSGMSTPVIENCTFVGNTNVPTSDGSAIILGSSLPVLSKCIIAFNQGGAAIHCAYEGIHPILYCCDIFGNPGGDWTGCIAGQELLHDNFSLAPMFCDTANDNFLLHKLSPCLPDNNVCGVLIGALGRGCPCDCSTHCDCNNDQSINPVDVVIIVNFVYKNIDQREDIPTCLAENGDWNCDGAVNPLDVVYYVNYVYRGVEPGPCDPCEL